MRRKIFWLAMVALILPLAGCGASKAQKKQADTHYVLGLSYLKEQNPTLALKEFLEAADYNPDDADIQAALGQTYQLKKAYVEAEEHYLEALKMRPGDPQIQNNLGALYLDLQRWDDAIRYFQMASSNLLFTSPEVALTGMGFAHFQKGEYANAVVAYKKALNITPRYPLAYLRLGEAYFAMDKTAEAIDAYHHALSLAPDYTLAHYKLALSYLKIRETEKAADSFREVVRLAPDSEQGQLAKDYLKLLN